MYINHYLTYSKFADNNIRIYFGSVTQPISVGSLVTSFTSWRWLLLMVFPVIFHGIVCLTFGP